ncbi:MAG: sel1 repeat family protein, partial [Proteobacteria bacterium]
MDKAELSNQDFKECLLILMNQPVLPEDLILAFNFCKRSAVSGVKEAQSLVGVMYERGEGTTKDPNQALYWYMRAVKNGFAASGFYAYDLLLKRNGPGDYDLAQEQLFLAAELGYGEAMTRIGLLHGLGSGYPKDEQVALSWFLKAASAGSGPGAYNAAQHYQVIRDIPNALKFFEAASDLGFGPGSTSLAFYYRHGIGVEKDERLMLTLYQIAIEQGDPEAGLQLGEIYFMGSHPEVAQQDFRRAAELLEFPANRGNVRAIRLLADLYM